MDDPQSQESQASGLQFKVAAREQGRNVARSHPLRYIEERLSRGICGLLPALKLSPGARVLDFGCADQPYRRHLAQGVLYAGADIPGNPVAEMTIDAEGRLPADVGGFDAVLSTQVLEHVQNPTLYLAECWRALAPGGRLLLSTHGIMIYHPDPVDHWRWTGAGLQRQVESAGFRVMSRVGIVGLAATGIYLFQEGMRGRVPRRLRGAFIRFMQWLMRMVDASASETDRAVNALVFIIIAEKPTNPS